MKEKMNNEWFDLNKRLIVCWGPNDDDDDDIPEEWTD